MRLTRTTSRFLLLCVAGLLAALPGWAQTGSPGLATQIPWAQSPTIVGIVEGSATLIRQTTRYALAESVALNEQDIIETGPGAFVQIELPGGTLIGLGESTRLMLRPRTGKGMVAPPLYLLQGWLKTTSPGAFGYTSPAFELSVQAASTVAHASDTGYDVFVESGTARLALRDGAKPVWQLAGGDFAQRREGASPTTARRAPPEFLAKVPRQFRDRLPARGEKFGKRQAAPKALGDIAYTDVAAWLHTEPGLRLPLLPLWRARAQADPAFRAAAKAELARHPEWEPYADPEGYARRMAQEAERRRAREAARQAARRAATAAEAGGGSSGKP
ncbi:hypothetical protein GCM10023165_20090 [Variovorax defluvii]|uniref:FecR protein domain-containing protein n=1 Tax=Variovorax defluvii TaxID=913761 RepID=A0ABP8HJL1_9BURK